MNPNPKAKPDLSTESGRSPGAGKFKRFLVLILGLIIIGLAVILSLRAWEFNELHPRTDDAVSRANIIGIAPRVSGPIIKINVTDNQFGKGGDLPFEIDPPDFQLNVDRAKSSLDALDQQIETGKSQDAQLKFQVKASGSGRPPGNGWSEIRLQILCIVLNLYYQKPSQQKSKLTRRAQKSPPLTPRSRKQTRNSTKPVSLSAPWPRFKPNVPGRLQPWERRSWSYLIPGYMRRSMAKS